MTGSDTDFGVDALTTLGWQMTLGERSALEGLLTYVRPTLSVEIGTAEGGSLTRIAAHSAEVHSFDLVAPQLPVGDLDHVHLHGGDSHVLLPEFLKELAEAGRNVDFALVDGDHSAAGTRQDIVDLVDSDACQNTVIIAHDAANEEVRAGIVGAGLDTHPKVTSYQLDFVPGFLAEGGPFDGQLWGGFALAIVGHDDAPRVTHPGKAFADLFAAAKAGLTPADPGAEASHIAMLEARLREMEDERLAPPSKPLGTAVFEEAGRLRRERDDFANEISRLNHALHVVETSVSYRVTAPLRAAMQRLRP